MSENDGGTLISGGSLRVSPNPIAFAPTSISVTARHDQQAVAIFDGHGQVTLLTDITDVEDLPFTRRQRTIIATRLRAIADELDNKENQ